MTLLITVFAALTATITWYNKADRDKLKLGTLSLIYWGAALMWLVDAVAEYLEPGKDFFSPSPLDMLNDAFLGLSAVSFGFAIWLIYVLITDPKGVLKSIIKKR